jgi:hypothetical protein
VRVHLGRDQVDAIAEFDEAGANDGCVHTQLSVGPANDVAKNVRLLHSRVGIVGCHDATATKINKGDQLLIETTSDVVRHLEVCPACRAELEGRRALRARLQSALGRTAFIRRR